jgi:hypothetical protein
VLGLRCNVGLSFASATWVRLAGRIVRLKIQRRSGSRHVRRGGLACALDEGLFDEDAGKPDEPEAEALRAKLATWLERHAALRDELEAHERTVLMAPIGKAKRQTIIDAVWAAEGAQVLLFALGARALPAHDDQEHPYKIAREIGVLGATPPALLDGPELTSSRNCSACSVGSWRSTGAQ